MEPQKPFILSYASTERLKMASIDVHYYVLIGSRVLAAWLSLKRIKTIYKQLQNLKDQKKAALVTAALSRLNKTAVFTTWPKGTIAFLDGHIGVCNTPIFYLIWENKVNNSSDYATLLTNKPHTEEFPSIDFELIAYLINDTNKYLSDNKVLFQLLDITLEGSMAHSSLLSF